MHTYRIREEYVEQLRKKLKSIEKKCKKFDCPFSLKEVGEEFVETKSSNYRRYVLFEIEGVAQIYGWEFVALLESTPVGNLIKSAKPDVEIPEIYKTRNICDHCGTKRNRATTVLIRNIETGEYKQVGRKCLADYLGRDAESYAGYLTYIQEVEESQQESFSCSGDVKSYFPIIDALAYAVKDINARGYVPTRSFYHAGDMDSTMSKVYSYLMDRHAEMYSKEDKAVAEGIIEWAKGLDTTNNAYYNNLKTIAESGFVSGHNLGILVSAVPAKRRYDAEEERKATFNKYVLPEGIKVGDKVTIENAKLREVWSSDSYYGWTYLYRVCKDNHMYVWWTSKDLCLEDYPESEVDATVTGIVKDFTRHKGIPQLILTRCNVNIHSKTSAEIKQEQNKI